MTYNWTCDWCGKNLAHDADYAMCEITIERQSVPGDLDRKWAREVKPTRFFCVTSTRRDEANRMGLPLESFESEADCYERFIATVAGMPTDRPDAGLEWRLVEVDPGARRREKDQRKVDAEARKRAACGATYARQTEDNYQHAGPDGIGLLRLHPLVHSWFIRHVKTISEVEAMTDDELLALPRIGPARVEELRGALARFRGIVSTPQPSEEAH